MPEIKKLLESLDYKALHHLLSSNPSLANKGIPFDENNPALAHPLHRICDGVSSGTYSDTQATELASIFLEHGSNINGFGLIEKKDTPLIAAASLQAEKVGILYTDRGANIHHAGTHGGTALHWAAWTGRENLVDKLIRAGADIHKRCIDFKSTPLLWAVHGHKFDSGRNRHHQIECVRLLLEAGAEKDVSNKEGKSIVEFLAADDAVLKEMLS
jgi:ankyrin repeat protein